MRWIAGFVIVCSFLVQGRLIGQTPTDIEGLELWLRADQLADESGTLVWTDLSGNDFHARQSLADAQPALLADSPFINNQPYFSFDGQDDFMLMDSALTVGAVYLVINYTDPAGQFVDFDGLLTGQSGGGDQILFIGANGTTSFLASGLFGTNLQINDFPVADFSPMEQWKWVLGSTATPAELPNLSIGRDRDFASRLWHGGIAEIVVFDSELTPNDHSALLAYFKERYVPEIQVQAAYTAPNFCPLTLDGGPGFVQYDWSDGSDAQTTVAEESTVLTLQAVSTFGDTLSMQSEISYPGSFIASFALCAGTDSLWQTGLDAFSVTWQDGSTEPNYLIDGAGAFALSALDTSGCSFQSDTVFVSIDDFPVAMEIVLPGVFCTGNPLTLGTASSSVVQYDWSTGEDLPFIVPETAGTYWVTAHNNNGCVGRDTVEVIFDGEAPVVSFTVSPLCAGATALFEDASTSNDGEIATVNWVIGEDNFLGSTVEYTLQQPGQLFFSIEVETDAGCAAQLSDSLFVHPVPQIAFASSLACSGQTTLFSDQSNVELDVIDTWFWNFGNGATATTAEAEHTFDGPGNLPVDLVVTTNAGCSSDSSFFVPVYPSPQAQFSWSPTCAGSFMPFQSVTDTGLTGPLNYAWNFNGVAASGASSQHLFPGAGSYSVTHEVWTTIDGLPGCFDETSTTVVVSSPPQVQFNHSAACTDQVFSLNDQTVPGANDTVVSWQWTSLGSLIDTVANAAYSFATVGAFPVSLSVETLAGCQGSVTQWIDVGSSESPQIDFEPIIGSPPLEVAFTNSNSYGQNHSWDFGDGGFSSLENPVYTYQDSGVFTVQLFVLDAAGCGGLDTATVLVIEPYYDVAIASVDCVLEDDLLSVSGVIANYNNHRLTSALLSVWLENGTVVSELWEGDLAKNQLTNFAFQSQLNYDPEIHDPVVCVSISEPNVIGVDQVPTNNTLCKPIGTPSLEMLQPFPNPAVEHLNQWFILAAPGSVQLRVIQADGRTVAEWQRDFSAGLNQWNVNINNLRSGVYIITMAANGQERWMRFIKTAKEE